MICVFHEWKVIGLYYKSTATMGWNYGIQLIETHQCNKCGKIRNVIVEVHSNDSYMVYEQKLEKFKRMGAKSFYSEYFVE